MNEGSRREGERAVATITKDLPFDKSFVKKSILQIPTFRTCFPMSGSISL